MLKHKPATRRDAADAARLQAKGQNGDTILAHINPQEARLLDWLADEKIDAPRNPTTGLLSFGMSDGESGRSGGDANPGGVGGGPAGGQTGGGIGGNTDDGTGGRSGGYGDHGYQGSENQRKAEELGNYYRDSYINGMVDDPYAPKDTWTRVLQELMHPSPAAAPPGRYGAPNAYGPGIVGTVATNFAGPMMGGLMGVGAAMGRAQSPAAQEASMAENQATGAKNSTGQDSSGAASSAAGAASGAETAGALAESLRAGASQNGTVPAGYTMNPAGQLIPLPQRGSDHTTTGLPQPAQNLLMDYIWRGRQGSGLLGW